MSPWISIYLDLIRIAAASFVVYSHSNVRFLLPDVLPLAQFAHSAVTVFFVLSGYVIAFVSDSRERTWQEYVASRASRILPLAVLAMLGSLFADVIGRSMAPILYTIVPSDYPLVRLFAGLIFANEIWFLSIMPFSNVPYWSLTYEVWYYVLFAIAIFAPARIRLWLLAAVGVAIGPKILLLMPCWLLGVWAYRWRVEARWNRTFAAFLWLMSSGAFVGYHAIDLMRIFGDGWLLAHGGQWIHVHLTFSHYFGADWILSGIVALNFIAFRRLVDGATPPIAAMQHWINKVGALTFALYVFHFPLLYCIGASTTAYEPSIVKWAAVVAAAAAAAVLLGLVGEAVRKPVRTYLLARVSIWQDAMIRVAHGISQRMRAVPR